MMNKIDFFGGYYVTQVGFENKVVEKH